MPKLRSAEAHSGHRLALDGAPRAGARRRETVAGVKLFQSGRMKRAVGRKRCGDGVFELVIAPFYLRSSDAAKNVKWEESKL